MTKPSYEELRITKHSGSPQITDSARGGKRAKAAKETRTPPDVLETWAVIAWALQCRSNCLLFGKRSAEEMWLALMATLASIRDDYETYQKDWAKHAGKETLAEFIRRSQSQPKKRQRIKTKSVRRTKV